MADTDGFTPLVVMVFGDDVTMETVQWLLGRVTADRTNGGAELLASNVTYTDAKNVTVHVSAITDRLLDGAEIMELKKPDKEDLLREFSVRKLDSFKNSEDLDAFLLMSEKQKIILHELENIRFQDGDHVSGYSKETPYAGQSIVNFFLSQGLLESIYPLHDKEVLKRLGYDWYREWRTFHSKQPINEIRDYFGETIAMYFAFLEHYTVCLVPPAIVGLVYWCTSWRNVNRHTLFAVFNVLWTIIFMKSWKRKCGTLAYKWGTLSSQQVEETRPEYYGEMGTNKITDRREPVYPKWKRLLKFYGVSVPVIVTCLGVAIGVMFFYFWLEGVAIRHHKRDPTFINMVISYVPGVLYSCVILVMNAIYRRLAAHLNDWENHRLQSAYDNHLIVKLVLFDFVNNFLSLFYIAFYLRDMASLRQTLAIFVMVQQIIEQIQESLLPYLLFKRRKKTIIQKQKTQADCDTTDSAIKQRAEVESTMDYYEGTLDDYLELFLQYGYIFLFSSAFPMAAFWALFNNIIEIRSDAFKLCRIFRRPFAQPTSSIGAWQVAFEVLGVIAIMTNTLLIAMSPSGLKILTDWGAVKYVLLFVCAEHLVLGVQMLLYYLIPNIPGWVERELARLDYQSKQALRKEFLKGESRRKSKMFSHDEVGDLKQSEAGIAQSGGISKRITKHTVV